MPSVPLAHWLATLDSPALERITTLRPDVLMGAPVRDLDDLAERLSHPASVAALVRELPVPALQTLEAVVAIGAGATVESLALLLDPKGEPDDVHLAAVRASVVHLEDCGALWLDGERIRLNPGVLAVIDTPLGIGPPGAELVALVPAPELQKVTRRWGIEVPKRKADLVDVVLDVLGDPANVRRLVGTAPHQVADVLVECARLAAARMNASRGETGPDDDLPEFLRTPGSFGAYRLASAWAVENGLAYGPVFDPMETEIPSEVLLALLGPGVHAPFDPAPPALMTSPVAPEQVGSTGSAAITELLATTMATLEHLSRSPVPLLKVRGVGARELARLAKVLGSPSGDVRLVLELAAHLGLVATVGGDSLGVDDRFASWRTLPPARRAADLVETWLSLRYAPSQDKDADGRSLPVLSRFDDGDAAVATRGILLGTLGDLADGVGLSSGQVLTSVVTWRLPVVVGDALAHLVPVTLAEAERLGLVALGRLTAAGECVVAGRSSNALVESLTGMLPGVQSRAIFGSDLTVMVMGSPAPHVVDVLDAVAQREGRGQAATWRITPASARAALDAGYVADDLLHALRAIAAGEVPQPVDYLIRDVARRHGHLQVRAAGSVVVAKDEATAAEVAADRALRRLGLERIAPTVLLATAGPGEVLDALRGAGHLPVRTAADGSPVVQVRRLAGPPVPADDLGRPGDTDADEALARWAAELAVETEAVPRSAGRPSRESPAEAVARLMRGEAPPQPDAVATLAEVIRSGAPRLGGAEVDQLAHAVAYGLAVRLRYRASSGGTTVRVVSDLDVVNGYLFGWCHLRQDARHFLLSSILGVIAEPG